ncbi:MAG: methyltransferase domain-containing protein [Pseudodesulfovibrio sp.]|nr:methyltransferase domain-containing protein [Pseudodesulfovibrio sp.]
MTQPVDVIITLDYETFDTDDFLLRSDLNIDWDRDLIESTEKLATFLEGHGAKLTVLWETVEYFWLVDNGRDEVAERIAGQLQDLMRRGHDVQLHLHPAWQGVRLQEGQYVWPDPNRRIPTMPVSEFASLLERSIETMIALFKPIRPDYRVVGFRGRSYDVEPFQTIADTLSAHGILADSSKHGEGPVAVQLPNLEKVAPEGMADFLEYPIYMIDGRRWDYSGALRNVETPLHTLDWSDPSAKTLVMTGHCKQLIHYDLFENCLKGLREKLGNRLCYKGWQETIERDRVEMRLDSRLRGKYGKRYFESKWKISEDPFGSMALNDPYYRTLLEMVPSGCNSLLDMGCAEGSLTSAISERCGAIRTMGIDIAPTAVARAAERFPRLGFKVSSMLTFQHGDRFELVTASQNFLYFTAHERAVLFDHVESMLAPTGHFLLAWWTDSNYGNEENLIETECSDRFKVVEARNYSSDSESNEIKGNHRLLLVTRRIDLDEEAMLNRIFWEDKRVVCVSRRNADFQSRFALKSREWHTEKSSECDVLICDVPSPSLLETLRSHGSLVLLGADLPAGFLLVESQGQIKLAAKME